LDILAMNIPVKVPMLTKSPVKYRQSFVKLSEVL
jgi:hypothetical protein